METWFGAAYSSISRKPSSSSASEVASFLRFLSLLQDRPLSCCKCHRPWCTCHMSHSFTVWVAVSQMSWFHYVNLDIMCLYVFVTVPASLHLRSLATPHSKQTPSPLITNPYRLPHAMSVIISWSLWIMIIHPDGHHNNSQLRRCPNWITWKNALLKCNICTKCHHACISIINIFQTISINFHEIPRLIEKLMEVS